MSIEKKAISPEVKKAVTEEELKEVAEFLEEEIDWGTDPLDLMQPNMPKNCAYVRGWGGLDDGDSL